MALTDLNILGFLKTKMHWHQARQRVLAENVANADTPSYRRSDLRPLDFKSHLAAPTAARLAASGTDPAHIVGGAAADAGGGFERTDESAWERTPSGNAVVLEEEMITVSENAFDYQLASTLYARSLGLLRTALGRNG